MSEQASLQTILQQRQRQEFVGREKQLTIFRENLTFQPDDGRRRFIFNIYGQGGVGKTSLLRQLLHLTKQQGLTPAWVDEQQDNTLAVMSHLVEQLDPHRQFFRAFRQRYRTYQQLCRDLEADPLAPKGSLATFVRQTLLKAFLQAGHSIPVAGQVLNTIGDDALTAQVEEATKYIRRKLRNPDDRRLIQEPIAVLTPLFLTGLSRCAIRTRAPLSIEKLLRRVHKRKTPSLVPLFFDTYERTGDFLDEWLRGMLAGQYGEVSSSLIILISGRDELDKDRWISYWDFVASLNIEPFLEQETRLYLSRKGITDAAVVEVIERLSGGLPLLVATLAAEHPDDPNQVGDPSGTAVDRFLKWVENPVRGSVAVHTALARRFNRDILKELVKDQDVNETFSWLVGLPFVYEQGDVWRYHEVVREQMQRRLRHESPHEWTEIHSKLANFYENLLEGENVANAEAFSDPTLQLFFGEAFYHRLCQAPRKEFQPSLNAFFVAFTIDEHFAASLAKGMLQAGEEGDTAEIMHWGSILTRGINAYNEKQYEAIREMLTQLIESDLLDEQSSAISYAWRGLVHLELGQHAQALEDLNSSLDAGYAFPANEQAETPSGSAEPSSLPIGANAVWLLLLLGVLLLLLNHNKIGPLSFTWSKDTAKDNLQHDSPKAKQEESASAREQTLDDESIAFLREYLKRLMKRQPLT
ncbi:MAG TPA: ATP-binding protein [Ktedonobacteraceae bacterium]|nr:ATP-binding protein [Ktedonobacteraceae bacterium]